MVRGAGREITVGSTAEFGTKIEIVYPEQRNSYGIDIEQINFYAQ